MELLQKLGFALGFATLAGLDLYMTVFAASAAIHFGWIVLGPEYHDLQILGHPMVMLVSGVLYFLEFFADKVPWVDSAWDAVHTFIRPVGGAFLAMKTLGHLDPVFDVVVALLAGGVTLTVHGAKSGTRLVANTSPEPFSNIALSVTEDVAAAGGLGLMAYSFKHDHPYLVLGVFGVVVLTLLYLTPKVFRFVRVKGWLFWKRFFAPPAASQDATVAGELPADDGILFGRLNLAGETVAWAAPCLTGRSKGGLPADFSGWLVATEETPGQLHFVGRRGWRSLARTLDLTGCKATCEPRFLSEDLTLYHPVKGTKQVFAFDRSKAALARAVTERVRAQLAGRSAAVEVRQLVGA